MSACGAVSQSHEVEFNALEGSLNMMSKVLNDVLDLCVNRSECLPLYLLIAPYSHRMDSGRFESFNKVQRIFSLNCSTFLSFIVPSPMFFIKSWNRFLRLCALILIHGD